MTSIITVFGGTGFLGAQIVRVLAERGHRVRIAARRPERCQFGELEPLLERRALDIRDAPAVAHALEGAVGAVNAVSLYVERRGSNGFAEIHVEAAGALALSAKQRHIRLIHISGIGGSLHSPSAYVRARALGEIRVQELYPAAIVLRPSVLFGHGEGLLGSLDRLTRLRIVPMFGWGWVRLQPTHVDDVALAVAEALEKPTVTGVFELGGADLCHYRQIVEAVAQAQGRRCYLVAVPFPVWGLIARSLSFLPNPPLTVHQLALLGHDNVAAHDRPGYLDLGLTPRGILHTLRETQI